MQRITFVCEGNAPPDLPKCIYCMFAQIICDPASLTAEVSLLFFLWIFAIAFPNNMLVSKFRG